MSVYLDQEATSQKEVENGFDITILFDEENPVFKGHYPDYPVFPASLVIDVCKAYVDRLYKKGELEDRKLFLSRSNFYKGIQPGDNVLFCYSATYIGSEIDKIDVEMYVASQKIAKLEFKWLEQNAEREIRDKSEQSVLEEGILSHERAIDRLPQRYPLLVVDKVIKTQDQMKGQALKYVSYGDYCFRNVVDVKVDYKTLDYADGAVIEGIEQSAVCLLEEHWDVNAEDRVVLIGGINGVNFLGAAHPGDTVIFESTLEYLSEDNAILSGTATVNGKDILTIDKIFVVSKS